MHRSRGDGRVRIGLQRNTPPFSYSPTARFQPIGYSVDLAHAVLARIHGGADRVPPVEVVEVTSTTREGLLAEGRIDLECGSTTITAERLRRCGFSRPIFHTAHRIALKGGSRRASPRVVGIQGSTSQAALETGAGPGLGHTFVGVPSIGAARDAFLNDDGIDAIVADEVILRSLLAGGPARAGVRMLEGRLGGEDYGFLLRKDDREMLAAVDAALADVFASAEYRELIRKWFHAELPGLGFGLGMDPADDSFVSVD